MMLKAHSTTVRRCVFAAATCGLTASLAWLSSAGSLLASAHTPDKIAGQQSAAPPETPSPQAAAPASLQPAPSVHASPPHVPLPLDPLVPDPASGESVFAGSDLVHSPQAFESGGHADAIGDLPPLMAMSSPSFFSFGMAAQAPATSGLLAPKPGGQMSSSKDGATESSGTANDVAPSGSGGSGGNDSVVGSHGSTERGGTSGTGPTGTGAGSGGTSAKPAGNGWPGSEASSPAANEGAPTVALNGGSGSGSSGENPPKRDGGAAPDAGEKITDTGNDGAPGGGPLSSQPGPDLLVKEVLQDLLDPQPETQSKASDLAANEDDITRPGSGPNANQLAARSADPVRVPEPSALLLLVTGLAWLGASLLFGRRAGR
ncbi:PEP-CTERM sorting domain-containing protein [Noviherbaspirillum galbum]|uniref:PEP-CTERM sorting domain-containing protein n=1 Tax=Noviherbaspirillum galbum TaxID=2709383 RepID=A0A6B3SMN8_9BURK|nr:PEP-CTERM sorting domain-containing protein [Noviherbaspirillum galbum]NEX59976.1 PEP-CTERM sorting domain-containing protein [Noviherbaspirillum galbum]